MVGHRLAVFLSTHEGRGSVQRVKSKTPTILIDTREQMPLDFSAIWQSANATLQVGDYTLRGHSSRGVVVERKSLSDLFGSFVGKRAWRDMARKLDLMGARYYRSALVVEATPEMVFNGPTYGAAAVRGTRLFGRIVNECAANGVTPIFCATRSGAARAVVEFFRGYLDAIR